MKFTDSRRRGFATTAALVLLGVVTVGVVVGSRLVQIGTRFLPRAATTANTPTPTPFHRECVSGTCKRVAGSGDHTCDNVGSSCTITTAKTPTPTPFHRECVS